MGNHGIKHYQPQLAIPGIFPSKTLPFGGPGRVRSLWFDQIYPYIHGTSNLTLGKNIAMTWPQVLPKIIESWIAPGSNWIEIFYGTIFCWVWVHGGSATWEKLLFSKKRLGLCSSRPPPKKMRRVFFKDMAHWLSSKPKKRWMVWSRGSYLPFVLYWGRHIPFSGWLPFQ